MSLGEQKIRIGISSCLLGQKVRYDGGHKLNDYIVGTLGGHFEFVPFCPEVHIGMGVPRPPIRLVATDSGPRAMGVRDVKLDVTEQLRACAHEQISWHGTLSGYILKKDSPSCGMERVKLYRDGMPSKKGVGVYAAGLMANFPLLPVEEEGRLGDPALRTNFLERVGMLYRWQTLVTAGITMAALTTFHSRYKLILISHHQNDCRALGRLLANADALPLADIAAQYISGAMVLSRRPATRRNHVNVLQHIQGYLKSHLDAGDKAELTDTIDCYRCGQLPLIAPITLLKHHFRRKPDTFIDESYYLSPTSWGMPWELTGAEVGQ